MDAQYQSDDDVLERLEPDTPKITRSSAIPDEFQDQEVMEDEEAAELGKSSDEEESEIVPDPVQIEPSHNTASRGMDIDLHRVDSKRSRNNEEVHQEKLQIGSDKNAKVVRLCLDL